eukprot:s717_g25.t1
MAASGLELPPPVDDDSLDFLPPPVDDDSLEVLADEVLGHEAAQQPLQKKAKTGGKTMVSTKSSKGGEKTSAPSTNSSGSEPLELFLSTRITCRGDDLMEFFSVPRLVPVCQELGMQAEVSLDLQTGWDANDPAMRQLAFEAIEKFKPWVIMLSPPCTVYSQLQRLWNESRMDPLEFEIRCQEADGFMEFTKDVATKQSNANRGWIFEHPATASSWDLPCVLEMGALPGAQVSTFDQCRYQLRGPAGGLMKKRTKLLSNLPQIHAEFEAKTCQCRQSGEEHELIQGSFNGVRRSTHAQCYPEPMVRALVSCCHEYVTQHGQ